VICRRAAEIINQSLDGPLPILAATGLRVHTLFCSPCRRFKRQMVRVHESLTASMSADVSPAFGGLSQGARERLAAALARVDDSPGSPRE
jgi:hypothetical protein